MGNGEGGVESRGGRGSRGRRTIDY